MSKDVENEEQELDTSTSTPDETDVESSTTTADEADTESSSAESSDKEKISSREKLIQSLTGKGEDDAEETEDDSEEEEETSKSSEEESEGEEAEEVEEVETSKGSESMKDKTKKRFEALTSHNHDLKSKLEAQEPVAKYGQSVLDFCKEAKLSPQELGVWLSVAATAKKDPSSVGTHLEKLGVKAEPVVQKVAEIPEGLEDAILDLASDGSLTPEGVKKLLGMTRAVKTAAPAKPAPKPAAEVETQTTKLNPPPDPKTIEFNTKIAQAVTAIDVKDAAYAKQYPTDWPKIREQITEAMKRYQGTDPSTWPGFFVDEVEKAIAKIKRPVVKTKALRPSTTSGGQHNKPQPHTRDALIAELTGKTRKKE